MWRLLVLATLDHDCNQNMLIIHHFRFHGHLPLSLIVSCPFLFWKRIFEDKWHKYFYTTYTPPVIQATVPEHQRKLRSSNLNQWKLPNDLILSWEKRQWSRMLDLQREYLIILWQTQSDIICDNESSKQWKGSKHSYYGRSVTNAICKILLGDSTDKQDSHVNTSWFTRSEDNSMLYSFQQMANLSHWTVIHYSSQHVTCCYVSPKIVLLKAEIIILSSKLEKPSPEVVLTTIATVLHVWLWTRTCDPDLLTWPRWCQDEPACRLSQGRLVIVRKHIPDWLLYTDH